jgi:dienelactone hydrolase
MTHAPPATAKGREVVTFPSGALTLHGIIFKPSGPGPFPAVLWNHGSYDDPTVAFDELGPVFATRGWVFFGPFRRGQGLSASAGPYIVDQIERASKQGGTRASAREMVRLLTGDHLADQLAAYEWLKQQPSVSPNRIAVAGNSFGGIETVFGAERVPYCAAVDAAGGAQSWAAAPELQDVMVRAAQASRAPMFLFQAANDFDLTPSQTLAQAMRAAGKTVELKIYPPFGKKPGQGHSFAWHGSSVWADDVLAFLSGHCSVAP